MANHKVCLSPSNQTDNRYACGHSTEAETCGKIAQAARIALERNGFSVVVPHLEGMAEKCRISDEFGAELHVPIHTNAADAEVGGTRVFCSAFGGAGHKACNAIFSYLAPLSPGGSDAIKEAPSLYEVRVPKAPTAYIECEFHHVTAQAEWIENHITEQGEAIAHGICDYFLVPFKAANDTPEKPAEPAEPGKVRYRVYVKAGRVGSYSIEGNALRVQAELEKLGVSSYIERVTL